MAPASDNSMLVELIRGFREENSRLYAEIVGIRQEAHRDAENLALLASQITGTQAEITSTLSSIQTQITALTEQQIWNTKAIQEASERDKMRRATLTGFSAAIGALISMGGGIIALLSIPEHWRAAIFRWLSGE